MGAELAACSTAFQLRKCGTKNPVYHKRSGKRQFKFPQSDKKGAFPNENALLKLLYLRISELYKKWKNIDHRLRMLDAADQVEEAGLLGEAYERLISSYQKARGLNDEMEELVKDALIN